MGIATFPTDQFLYAKLDKQMRYVYCNAFHEALFLRPRSEFIGVSAEELALAGASPKCMIHLMFDTVRERGFANSILPFINEEGKKQALEAGNQIQTAPPELVAEVQKLNEQFEADYIKSAEEVGVDGAAILAFFRAEVKKLAGN